MNKMNVLKLFMNRNLNGNLGSFTKMGKINSLIKCISKVGSCIIIVECSLALMLIPSPKTNLEDSRKHPIATQKQCSTFK